jgi:hypothetical protein
MSEVQKPVEEPVVAPTTETPVAEPVAESKPVEETAPPTETATETPAVAEPAPAATEEVVAPVTEEAKPIEEGTLGYKGPGLIKYVFPLHFLFMYTPECTGFLFVFPRGSFVYFAVSSTCQTTQREQPHLNLICNVLLMAEPPQIDNIWITS